jgi:radical SAM protein with 4Fe4S-binding SPASM domain
MGEAALLERRPPAGLSDAGSAAGRAAPSLLPRLWQLAEQKCIPLSATLEITLRCNLACVHCYNFDRSAARASELAARQLDSAEGFDIIDQLAAAGCLFLSFTGGEALLHPDVEAFIRHARRRRFAVRIKTNGATLSAAKVRMLVDAGVRRIDVSLYGATPATHDAFTARPGSLTKTLQAIHRARAAGIRVRVNMCLVRSNATEIGRMIELVEGLGCSVGIDPFITARYDGTNSSLDHVVGRDDLERLYCGPLRRFRRPPDFDPKRSVQCACARSNCGITATGEVYPCIGAPLPCGNLRVQSFADIWKHSPQLNWIRQLKLEHFTACKSCPVRPFCRRNSGVVYANTGNYTGPEASFCRDAWISHDLHAAEVSVDARIESARLRDSVSHVQKGGYP